MKARRLYIFGAAVVAALATAAPASADTIGQAVTGVATSTLALTAETPAAFGTTLTPGASNLTTTGGTLTAVDTTPSWTLSVNDGTTSGDGHLQKGAVGGAFRMIPHTTPQLQTLGLSPSVPELCSLPRGLVLVTGPTGSGKSTTLAAMIDKVNRERKEHIVTVEDPIEFVHEHKGCLVNQREVFSDTHSFAQSLKHVLRQDPDIVLIGEMRDLETIEASLVVAETGHLAFSTLHTNCAVQTINRIIDVFPPHQQSQVRAQLSLVLQAVISQQLIPRRDGRGRVLAAEVMIPNAAIRNLIREEKVHQIYSQMQVGQTKFGMQTMTQSLVALVQQNLITPEEAIGHATEIEEIRTMLGQPRLGRAAG